MKSGSIKHMSDTGEAAALKIPENFNSYELSPLQEGMLIHSLAEQGVGMYISQGVHFFDHINVSAMEQAWQKVVDRHEVLRTTFEWEGLEKPLQIVHSRATVKFIHHDLQPLPEWEQKIKLRAILALDRQKGFDFRHLPLFRLHLLKLSEQRYCLVFSHHHLLLDGWSNPILLDEVRTFYHAVLRQKEVVLPQPKPFRLYIQWLKNQTLEKESLFWQDYLKGFKRTTPLPYDLGPNRQAGQPLESEEWALELWDPLFTRLKATARKCRVTLNTMLQAAWAILLSRYSQNDQVVFGSLLSGRSSVMEGIENMIGMFLNTLPMHVKVDQNACVKDWLQYVHARQNVLHDHEFSPLNQIQRWSELPRGAVLFDSVIDTNNTHQPQKGSEEALLAPINQSVPLLLFAKPATGRLVLLLIYNKRRFTKPCIVQVGEQLLTLLSAMCEDVHRKIGGLSMISNAEAQRTLVTWNETRVDYPDKKVLHQLFEKHAAATPAAPAVHYLDTTYSYAEFNQKSNQLARYLYSMNITRGKLVGFCLDRSLEMVVVLMAILKSGAGYVPLDPNYPLDRLKMMLSTSKAQLLITQKKWARELGEIAPQTICTDTDSHVWADQETSNLDLDLSPEDIAYVLFTSGSTGTPKGIVIPHKVPVNRMFIEHDPFETHEALCAKTSICFVDSVWELWSAWSNGLPLSLIPEDHIKDPEQLINTLSDSGSSRMVLVPSLLRSIMDAEPDLGKRLPRMKHWICSGEALPGDLSARFIKEVPRGVLTNLYGATEIWDVTRCDTRDNLPYEPMPIGKIMGNMRGYVLDDMMQPVPTGIVGELHFGGVHVAHGYWKRPDITARQFVPDPFSKEPGQRLYKTGDLGRWLPDGNFEYLGRRDQQVQLRGFRIELGDIESTIRRHPDVAQAAVVISDDQRLVAYVVTNNDAPPDSAQLRKYVRQQLPEHMTPAFYLPLKTIPLTPNGKTDRRRLPRPKAEEMKQIIESEAGSRPPETRTEKTVAAVWANQLGLDKVGAESDFFQLGGESLMAVRIITRLGKMFHLTIPLSVLMKTRTVSDMAAWIDDTLENGLSENNASIPEILKKDHGKKAPLSYAQQQMWLLDQLNPGSVSYTVAHTLRFSVEIDIAVLNQTLTQIIQRHETLRTTFDAIDGKPFQVINDAAPVSVPVKDLTELPRTVRETAAWKKVKILRRKPWDLKKGPLFRYVLMKLDNSEFLLAMTLHHITTDGRSMGILSHEIQQVYHALSNGRPSLLTPLPVQYADYAIWQRNWLKGNQIASQIAYWKKQLDEATVLEIPFDHPRPAVHQYRGEQVGIQLEKSVLNDMRRLAVQEGATVFMALLAVFQLLLARYTGQDDICVGTPTANRARPELEPLIGYFINTLVIRIKLAGNPSFREVLNITRAACVEAYDHQDVPFEILVDKLGIQRNLSHNPLFQVLFVHQKMNDSVRQPVPEQETANFDLVLNVQEFLDSIVCQLIFNADMFEKSTIRKMGERLELLIRQCVANPDQVLSQNSLLLPDERMQILHMFSRPKTQKCETLPAHQIIADHARRFPEKIAVWFENTGLSYVRMDQCANQMARYLAKQGVGPESVVGWCVERKSDILVGLLGIMKAGGAFLPMDPDLPADRMAYMIKDAGISIIVTQKHISHKIPSDHCRLVFLDEDRDEIQKQETNPLEIPVRMENLAYIIYTSGSTGVPKGVMIEHRNLANLISAQIPEFHVTPDSRVMQTLSLGFDASLGEIFRTLMAGGTLVLAHKDDLMPGPILVGLLKNYSITSVAFSAATLAAMPRVAHELGDLKNLTVGGDTIMPEIVSHWCVNRRFMNGYGPTEATIGATLAVNWDPHAKPPLGVPLPNVSAYVLDRFMQPVPIGTPGELHIGGVGVSRGYLNRPDLTAAAFVPDPFAPEPGSRLYRTGDMVRWLPDGRLDFLGRMDHQVKIRGYRIELSEIASVLNRHPKVCQSIVVVHQTRDMKRLAAYVTPAENQMPETKELRLYLKACLPDYMVPAFVIVCDRFPMTVSGKIDRNALPEPSEEQLNLDREYAAPKTDTEKLLADIWADILGLEKVGIHSNYFELGGDSIMSIRIVARITEAGYQLSLQQMFTHQTIFELAAVLDSENTQVTAEQGIVTGKVPLTPVQQWFFEQGSGNPHYFNQWMAIPSPSALNTAHMRNAVLAVMQHHDALRMRYHKNEKDQWEQQNEGKVQYDPFRIVDLSTVPDHECGPVIEDAFQQLQESLNLEEGRLFNVCWFNPGPHQTGRLLVTVHHIVMDIVSWSALIEDLMKVYRRLDKAKTANLPVKTSSFRQWAYALVDFAKSRKLRDEVPYWLRLMEKPCQPYPVDYPEGDHSLLTTRSVSIEMDESQTRKFQHSAVPFFNTQVGHLLLAALAVALSRHSSNTRIQITIEGQGREDTGVELNLSRTLGWFTSFYPVGFEVVPDQPLQNQIQVAIRQIESVPNRGIGYSVLRYLADDDSIRSQMASIPGSDISFNFTGQSSTGNDSQASVPDTDTFLWGKLSETGKIQLAESSHGPRRHLIEIGAGIINERLAVRFAFGSRRFQEKNLKGLGRILVDTIGDIIQISDLQVKQ
jgi:amino acid adenylation domain-containing protein/non-ribosomal peptide synthase protein (TIGR01720 family)